jgi:hypothetical protein
VCVCGCAHELVGSWTLCMGSHLFCEWSEGENMIHFK